MNSPWGSSAMACSQAFSAMFFATTCCTPVGASPMAACRPRHMRECPCARVRVRLRACVLHTHLGEDAVALAQQHAVDLLFRRRRRRRLLEYGGGARVVRRQPRLVVLVLVLTLVLALALGLFVICLYPLRRGRRGAQELDLVAAVLVVDFVVAAAAVARALGRRRLLARRLLGRGEGRGGLHSPPSPLPCLVPKAYRRPACA